MREINYRYMYNKPNSNTILYVTRGPLAQLANELNEHFFYYHVDFNEKYFKSIYTDGEEWEHEKAVRAMLPTKQLELRMAELDTMKVEDNAANVTGLPLATEGTQESSIAKEKLIAWQRDAVVAELDAFERLIKDPKMVYCPEISDFIDFNIDIGTLLTDFIAREKTVWKLRDQMSNEFRDCRNVGQSASRLSTIIAGVAEHLP